MHCPGQAMEQGAYLARIGAALRFDVIQFFVNTPFVCITNGKRRFVMRVDSVSRVLEERAACYTAHG